MAESSGRQRVVASSPDDVPAARVPFPKSEQEFKTDDRVSFDKTTEKFVLEEQDGSEWEWNDKIERWVPSLDEALIEQQQQVYRIDGVDDEVTGAAENNKKRKAELKEASDKKKAKNEPKERPNAAIYVSNIPTNVSFDQIYDKFKKFGLIEEDVKTALPKIRLYANEEGNFRGDARIIYFKPQSVSLAITMLDKTDFETGGPGTMKVELADFSLNNKTAKQKEVSADAIKKGRSKQDRAAAIRKTEEMNRRLADWDDDDISVVNPAPNPTKYNRMVVLKHMFTLAELEEDKEALIDIKADIRDEAAKYGTVTNVILYDLEMSGVVTVRFTEPESASRCAAAFDNRSFSGRLVIAYVPEHKEQYRKSSKNGEDGLHDLDEDENDP